MTRFEYMTGDLSLEEAAAFLCSVVDHRDIPEDHMCCDFCIAREKCCFKHNGFVEWLMEEHKA